MIFEESYTLHNGVAIPKLALGTWFIDDDKAAEAVRAAVNIGYRHIDTAQRTAMNVASERESAPAALTGRISLSHPK